MFEKRKEVKGGGGEGEGGGGKGEGGGGEGGVPNTQLKDKTMALLNSNAYHFGLLGCHFHVKPDIIPLSFLWPCISM